MSKEIFTNYFSPNQLRLAWERYVRSTGRDVKDYFGIELFSSDLETNLSWLSEKIIDGRFSPRRPFKYFEPKASKTQRTKTVLPIEDALVYQAIVNRIAEKTYDLLYIHEKFVFGSVLHPEVKIGIDLLEKEDAQYFFFQYYLPLYNKFLDSVNQEIKNTDIKYKLETDITGFFDCIPHSKLLVTLHQNGVEVEILDLLSEMLNIYSGTSGSITPGVGIPQGAPASFFLANLFLNELDHLISKEGYTYYRYMDDVRIYEETEHKTTEALVLVDNFLKGKALSLNTKKTSVEEISERKSNKLFDFSISGADDFTNPIYEDYQNKEPDDQIKDQTAGDLELITYGSVSTGEAIEICLKDIEEVESVLLDRFKDLGKHEFSLKPFMEDEEFKKELIHWAFKWRAAQRFLQKHSSNPPNPKLIPIWLFGLEFFFWKANHFCWNLNLYGTNEIIKNELNRIFDKLKMYEWVRFQILSNMGGVQRFSSAEQKELFRRIKTENSPLVRYGYYLVLMKGLSKNQQLYTAVKNQIKDEKEKYVKQSITQLLLRTEEENNLDTLSYWFGL